MSAVISVLKGIRDAKALREMQDLWDPWGRRVRLDRQARREMSGFRVPEVFPDQREQREPPDLWVRRA